MQDGKVIADEIISDLREEVNSLKEKSGKVPGLAVVLIGEDPASKVYVKVYAKKHNGQVVFHKDGYTDLRGKFDYSSINTGNIDEISSFSFLVLSDSHGAVIKEAKPPKK